MYELSCGGREVVNGACEQDVGNTVNEAEATWTSEIGRAILGADWEDPDFDPNQHAFYYVRLLKIPTPRWTTHDAAVVGMKHPEEAPVSIQDRAYTSPIWCMPKR